MPPVPFVLVSGLARRSGFAPFDDVFHLGQQVVFAAVVGVGDFLTSGGNENFLAGLALQVVVVRQERPNLDDELGAGFGVGFDLSAFVGRQPFQPLPSRLRPLP